MRKLVATSAIAMGLAMLPVTAAHAGTTWIVGIKASSTTINVGQKITFTGQVRPGGAAAGQKVTLQERFKPGSKWTKASTATITKKGTYQVSEKPKHNTTHAFRVLMPTIGKHKKGVSKTVQVTVYDWIPLQDLESVNGNGMEFGSVNINGKSFRDSLTSFRDGGDASIEFNLNHGCDKLRATFGISDDSTTGGQAEVGVLQDGTSIYDKTFDLGQSQDKTLALDTPLKIKLLATDTSTAPDTFGLGAFGSPQAHCTL
jgi:hypothetical protein